MTKQTSTHAAAAKMIRAELKRHGIQARVISKSYAGGNSVDVYLTDPLPATLDKVQEYVWQFQYGHFDGMRDSYQLSNYRVDLPQVRFAFVHAEYSDEIRQAAEAEAQRMNLPDAYMLLNGRTGNFWTSRKPRISA